MADLSDVTHALRDAIAAALGALGMVQPSQSWKGTRIYVGWPGADLDADLAKGVCHISIWPRAGMARTIGPYMTGWAEQPRPAPSLTVAISADEATFVGTGVVPQQIAAVIVDHAKAYTYPLQGGDGPAEVAAALATQVAADRSASAAGGVLSVPGAFSLVARVVAGGGVQREVRRLSQSIQVSAWCPAPALRDRLIRAVDEALIEDYRTLVMPDGTLATVTYEGTGYDEAARQQPLHRRDLFVSVEYSQARVRQEPAIAVPDVEYETDPAVIQRTILS